MTVSGSREVRHEMAARFARVLEADPATPWLLRRAFRADPDYRGRGLSMMRTCSDSVPIDHTPTDTQVTITSRPISVPQRISAHRNHAAGRSDTAGTKAPHGLRPLCIHRDGSGPTCR
jgi:hypothetical protein